MKNIKRTLALVLAAIMTLSVFAFADSPKETGADYDDAVVILYTNDVHSRVLSEDNWNLGYDGLAGVKEYYEAQGAEVLLFDAGDAFHGLPLANLSEGETIVDIMNELGYDLMAPGNHDFNYGTKRLIQLSEKMDFEMICANLTAEGKDETVFAPSAVLETETGLTIGVVGITTPETATKTPQSATQGYSFNADDMAELVQGEIDALQDEADYIIALGHLGVDKNAAPWRSTDIIASTSGLTSSLMVTATAAWRSFLILAQPLLRILRAMRFFLLKTDNI